MNKFFHKERHSNGQRVVYLLGKKVFSYKVKKTQAPRVIIDGEGNHVNITREDRRDVRIEIYGDNNTVDLRTNAGFYGRIIIGRPFCRISGCKVIIEEGCSCGGLYMLLMESDSAITLGKDCMLSTDIKIWCTDSHSIFNQEGQLINIGKSITIGDHCWIGANCTILKNTRIAPGCVIGVGSIVTTCFDEPGCAIAGVPAKVIKRHIRWERRQPQHWINEQQAAAPSDA